MTMSSPQTTRGSRSSSGRSSGAARALRSIGPLNVAQKGNYRKAAMPWSRPITGTHLYFPYEQKLGPIPVPSYSEIWLFSCTGYNGFASALVSATAPPLYRTISPSPEGGGGRPQYLRGERSAAAPAPRALTRIGFITVPRNALRGAA